MSTIKNDHISLYCHFNKIVKGPETSFQFPALSQKHVRNICHTVHLHLTKFHFEKKRFFRSNPYKIEVMITSLIEMPQLPNFGDRTTSTI